MAKIVIDDIDNNIPGDGSVQITLRVSQIDLKSEARAEALLATAKNVLADGKIDIFEGFQVAGLLVALARL